MMAEDEGPSPGLKLGDLALDPATRHASFRGQPVDLSVREFALLHTFALQPHTVISVDELLGRVWGAEFVGQPQVVYVHIRWLREKIEENILRRIRHLNHLKDRFRGFSENDAPADILARVAAYDSLFKYQNIDPCHKEYYRLYSNYIKHYEDNRQGNIKEAE